MEPKHTDSPWRYEKANGRIYGNDGLEVAKVFQPVTQEEIEMVEANISIMVNAPEMLKALKRIVGMELRLSRKGGKSNRGESLVPYSLTQNLQRIASVPLSKIRFIGIE